MQRQLWHSLSPNNYHCYHNNVSHLTLPAPKPDIGMCRQLTYSFSYTNKCIQHIKLQIIYIYELIHVSVISHHPQGDNA